MEGVEVHLLPPWKERRWQRRRAEEGEEALVEQWRHGKAVEEGVAVPWKVGVGEVLPCLA